MITSTENRALDLALNFIKYTSHPVFLTGKAGTGKTTFLKTLRDTVNKNMVVVAPTGVAAINAGGVTVHSFFQLPLGPFLPLGSGRGFGNNTETNDKHSLLGKMRISNERRKIFKELNLLVIDEISMVRSDVLDAIDLVLRHFRNNYAEPFGGVQVLYIGDLFQLPPVVKDNEWMLLRDVYESPFFFSSLVFKEQPAAYIELTKVYRQRDSNFIDLLNKVRNNEMDHDAAEMLNKREITDETFYEKNEAILLTSHNQQADAINRSELEKIEEPLKLFMASVEGEFNENAYPAEEILQLKIGARVMFIKNDINPAKRFFNGRIGKVVDFRDDKVIVLCTDGFKDEEIEVEKAEWENIRYSVKAGTKNVQEEVLGSFRQYPLRLAWAITIHKSQGLSFDEVVIDAGKAFAPGQVYVALSRARYFDGIHLKSRIAYHSLGSNQTVVNFTLQQKNIYIQEEIFDEARKTFERKELLSLFDYRTMNDDLHKALMLCADINLHDKYKEWLSSATRISNRLQEVGEQFARWCLAQGESGDSSLHENIISRLPNAAAWNLEKLTELKGLLRDCPIQTDNQEVGLQITEKIKAAFEVVDLRSHILRAYTGEYREGLFTDAVRDYRKESLSFNAASSKSGFISKGIKQPELYRVLRNLRDEICSEEALPPYLVCNVSSLEMLANLMPATPQDLQKIPGFGQVKVKKYGERFLSAINEYLVNKGLSSNMEELGNSGRKRKEPNPDVPKKPDTKMVSYDLYKSGKTVEEIADERKLTTQSILRHLAYYVAQKKLDVNDFVDSKKVEQVLNHYTEELPKETAIIKEAFPDLGYDEIRMILAYAENLER